MTPQRVLVFVNEDTSIRAALMSNSEIQTELEAIFSQQARASLHADAHLTLAIEALPSSPAVERSRASLRALNAQLRRWDAGLLGLAGVCEVMLSRVKGD